MRKKKDTHSFDFRPLGLAIREAREKAGLSRNDLGDKVFYGERHIADIENIGKHPSFQLFHDLVTMFNISVDEYFYPAKNVEKNTARRQIDSSLDLFVDLLRRQQIRADNPRYMFSALSALRLSVWLFDNSYFSTLNID